MKSGKEITSEVIASSEARKWLFDSALPWYNEEVKNRLMGKIMRHYYMCEIGQETAGLFQFTFNSRLYELLPKYNLMYKELDRENFYVLGDYWKQRQVTENVGNERNKKSNSTTTNQSSSTDIVSDNSNVTGKNVDKFSDTPENHLYGVENDTYLSSLDVKENNSTSQDDRTANSDTESQSNAWGNENEKTDTKRTTNESEFGRLGGKDFSQAIQEYVNGYTDIDLALIEELKDCFMMIY